MVKNDFVKWVLSVSEYGSGWGGEGVRVLSGDWEDGPCSVERDGSVGQPKSPDPRRIWCHFPTQGVDLRELVNNICPSSGRLTPTLNHPHLYTPMRCQSEHLIQVPPLWTSLLEMDRPLQAPPGCAQRGLMEMAVNQYSLTVTWVQSLTALIQSNM